MEAVAILSMDGRFPGKARDPESLWRALDEGRDLIGRTPQERWNAARYRHAGRQGGLIHASDQGGFIEDIDLFDPVAFGISPREAETMDPAQRLLLEASLRCWEQAGITSSRLAERSVGVFVGGFTQDYLLLQLGDRQRAISKTHSATGAMNTLLSNRLSHCWGLSGPSVTVDAACASSLTAIHLAISAINSGDCELALAGGAQLQLAPYITAFETAGGFLSPDGRCRAFDHRADGYVRSEAVALVLLAPLKRALAERLPILAVIRGSALNHNGASVGVSFPSSEAQTALIRTALSRAGVGPDDIGYVEAHGTGTRAGDRAELTALGEALGRQRSGGPLLVGSVKTNLGHCEAAAGITGLVKTVLAMTHRRVPPHLHWSRTQDDVSLETLGLRLPLQPEAWPEDQPCALVSSFGFGGANACIVVEPPPRRGTREGRRRSKAKSPSLVAVLSGPSPDHLPAQAEAFATFLSDPVRAPDAAAWCSARITGRDPGAHGIAVAAETCERLVARLQDFARRPTSNEWAKGARGGREGRADIGFVFCGMGPQWQGMGKGLCAAFPSFAEDFAEWDAAFHRESGYSVIARLGAIPSSHGPLPAELAQPLNVFLQASLVRLLRELGLRPHVVCGHSLGEVAAFHAAGALSRRTAAALVFHRSRLLGQMPDGGMAAVQAADAIVAPMADRWGLSIAARNSPTSVTVSGPRDRVDGFLENAAASGLPARRIEVDVPYHSAELDPLEKPFKVALKGLRMRMPKLSLISTVTGDRAPCGNGGFSDYWWRNLRQPVQFAAALRKLDAGRPAAVLEIGAHPVLRTYIEDVIGGPEGPVIASTLRRGEPDAIALAEGLARLHLTGTATPDWARWLGPAADAASLPGLQFQKKRYWSESVEQEERRLAAPAAPLLGYARPNETHIWDLDLCDIVELRLEEHVVLGRSRMPLAALLEMMRAAVRQSVPGGTPLLNEVKIHRGVPFGDGGTERLITRFDRVSGAVTIHDEHHRLIAQARAVSRRSSPCRRVEEPPANPDATSLEQRAFYRRISAAGFDYGRSFQRITRIACDGGVAIGQIDGTSIPDASATTTMLDAALQSMIALELAEDDRGAGSPRLPVGIEEAEFCREVRQEDFPLTAIARRRDWTDRETVADIDVLSRAGEQLVRLQGVTVRAPALPSALRGGRKAADLFLSIEWKPIDERALPQGPRQRRQWIIRGDAVGWAENLAAILAERGERVSLVSGDRSIATASLQQHDTRTVIVDLSRIESPADPEQEGPRVANFIRQADSGRAHFGAVEQWLLTRGAQSSRPDPFQAALWGAGRCLIDAEQADGWRGLIDLPEAMDAGLWARLIRLIEAQPSQTEFRLGDGHWWIPSLTIPAASAEGTALWLRQDASYIVTGAFGAIGRLSVEHLIDRGARHLVLLGQTDIPPRESWNDMTAPELRRKLDWLMGLERRGIRLIAFGVELADFQACRNAIRRVTAAGFPEIRGLVHAAGRTADVPASTITRRHVETVFGPKVLGIRNLLRALAPDRLELCVLHGSIASLFPAFGQSAYAAANAYLDALARQLSADGVPALSVSWGPWTVGMASERRLPDFFKRQGLLPIAPEEGRQLFDTAFTHAAPTVACAAVDWPVFANAHRRRRWLFAAMVAEDGFGTAPNEAIQIRDLQKLSPDALRQFAFDDLARCVAEVSRSPASTFTPETVLSQIGLDSLMGVELQLLVSTRWTHELTVGELLGRDSLGALARRLADRARDTTDDARSPAQISGGG